MLTKIPGVESGVFLNSIFPLSNPILIHVYYKKDMVFQLILGRKSIANHLLKTLLYYPVQMKA